MSVSVEVSVELSCGVSKPFECGNHVDPQKEDSLTNFQERNLPCLSPVGESPSTYWNSLEKFAFG